MSANSSNKSTLSSWQEKMAPSSRWWLAVALPLWVLIGFGLAQVVVIAAIYALALIGIGLTGTNRAVLTFVVAAIVYIVTLIIVTGGPWLLRRRPTTKGDIGLSRLPTWMDIGLAPAGFIIYFVISAALVYVASLIVPSFDLTQVQQTGFGNIASYYEYMLAFVTLVVIAPVAEEILFRGYLYGKLRKSIPTWAAILIVSALFGLVHGQWNVSLDVFALSIILCSLREITGSIWAGILVHMLKNSLAFYILFINPMS